MAPRNLEVGQKVLHPARTEWGVGEILGIQGTTARVLFQNGGLKQINTSYVTLLPADGQATNKLGWELDQAATIDIASLRQACDQFREEMRRGQSAQIGETIALAVISDVRQFRYLQKGTARLLAQSCETSASVTEMACQRAQEISKLIYGRVIALADLG